MDCRPCHKLILRQIQGPAGTSGIVAQHSTLGTYHLYCEGKVPLLFAENETNNARLFPQYPNPTPYVKDGINDYVVHGRKESGESCTRRDEGLGTLSADGGAWPIDDPAPSPHQPGFR